MTGFSPHQRSSFSPVVFQLRIHDTHHAIPLYDRVASGQKCLPHAGLLQKNLVVLLIVCYRGLEQLRTGHKTGHGVADGTHLDAVLVFEQLSKPVEIVTAEARSRRPS